MTSAPTNDFADWLPPMLVKELRQGLRTNGFVGVFVLVQVAMIAVLGARLATGENGDTPFGWDVEELDRLVWIGLGAALLVLMPLRGVTALSDEVKARTLDLVQLTYLSSFRIVWDKWLALVSQTLLLVIAVLPYQVLCYFFGGVDVVMNLKIMGWMVLLSLLLTAVCIAVSPASMLVRLLVLGAVGFPIYAVGYGLIQSGPASFGGGPSMWPFLFAIVMSMAFALSVATARISAAAENSSTLMRCIALLVTAGAMLGSLTEDSDYGFVWLLLICPILIWAATEAMTERASDLRSLYVPWVRRGPLGLAAGRLFYPGWGTGLRFVLVATASLVVGAFLSTMHSTVHATGDTWRMSRCVGMGHLGMALLFPAVLILLLPSVIQRHWLYVGGQVACAVFTANVMTIFKREDEMLAIVSALTPMSAFVWATNHNSTSFWWGVHLLVAVIVDVAILVFLFARSRPEFNTIVSGERKAELLIQAGAKDAESQSLSTSS